MKRLLSYVVIATGLLSCNPDKIFQSDIQSLIDNKTKSTEDILGQIEEFTRKHGENGFEFQNEIVKDFSRTHKKVASFLDSLEGFSKTDRHDIATEFVNKTFNKYQMKYSYETSFNENTPIDLIKLQIVDMENIYLREWEENVTHRFNNMSVVIVPDKLGFRETEKITGTVGFMAYSDNMKLKVKINGKDIEVRNGLGYFSVDPKDLKGGQESLRAEVIFSDTIYTTTVLVNTKR